MSVVERGGPEPRRRRTAGRATRRRAAPLAVVARRWRVVLAVALGLRVWGVKQGLPYAYNADENAHFVPNAIGLFGHGWDPHYFVNPPAYTYLLHVVFAVWFGGRAGVSNAFADQPDRGLRRRARHRRGASARSPSWLLYLAGAQALRPRASACWPPALLAVSLPAGLLLAPGAQRRADAGADRAVAVGHGGRAARGAPARLPARRRRPRAGVRDEVHRRDRAAAAAGGRRDPPGGPGAGATPAARGLVLAGRRRAGRLRRRQPLRRARPRGLPRRPAAPGRRRRRRAGQARPDPEQRATCYYLWTFTWGLGWVPLVAARRRPRPAAPSTTGARCSCSARRRSSSCSSWAPRRASSGAGCCRSSRSSACSPPTRSCALAQLASPARAGARARRSPCSAPCSCCGQGLVYSLHSGDDAVARPTRATRRAQWLVDHVPREHEDRRRAGRARRLGAGHRAPVTAAPPTASAGRSSRRAARTSPTTARSIPGPGRIVNIEDYERTLYPGLIDQLRRRRATAGW